MTLLLQIDSGLGDVFMNKVRNNKVAIFLFLLPASILFISIIILPIFMSGYYSLLDWDGIGEGTFIGLDNYVNLFTSPTVKFTDSLIHVFLYTFVSVFLQLPFSLLLALILAKGVKGERLFLSVFFVPTLISTTVIGQLWLKIYNPDYGILNVVLRSIGLEEWSRVWLGDQKTVLSAVFVPMLWQYIGYHMLLMYAGIKSIPPEYSEAAKIDGANNRQITSKIILPLLKPVLRICVIFSVVGSLKTFDLIHVLTKGGPAHASEVPSTLMVNMIFDRNRYGFGSAIAMFIIFICFFFAILIRKFFKVEEE